jgi:hypothetical protein
MREVFRVRSNSAHAAPIAGGREQSAVLREP